jgi:hypothetical protein
MSHLLNCVILLRSSHISNKNKEEKLVDKNGDGEAMDEEDKEEDELDIEEAPSELLTVSPQ